MKIFIIDQIDRASSILVLFFESVGNLNPTHSRMQEKRDLRWRQAANRIMLMIIAF